MIPTEVLIQLATLGLTAEQAKAVGEMLTTVESATKEAAEKVVEQSRAKTRARVQKWRENKEETLRNVTERHETLRNGSRAGVTRGEDISSNLEIAGKEKRKEARAARLPKDWVLPLEWRDEAIKAGLSPQRTDIEAGKMHNWSLSDRNGAKLDWHAAWRNWYRRAIDQTPTPRAQPPPRQEPDNVATLSRRQMFTPRGPQIDATDHPPGRVDPGDGGRLQEGAGNVRSFAVSANLLGRI